MKKIWIVEGRTGEYSDRSEWQVCAFYDENKAKEFVEELSDLARLTYVAAGGDAHEDTEEFKALQALDAKAGMDYTGTSYRAYAVEIKD